MKVQKEYVIVFLSFQSVLTNERGAAPEHILLLEVRKVEWNGCCMLLLAIKGKFGVLSSSGTFFKGASSSESNDLLTNMGLGIMLEMYYISNTIPKHHV